MKQILAIALLAIFTIPAHASDSTKRITEEEVKVKTNSYAGCDQTDCDFYNNPITFKVSDSNSKLRVSGYSSSPSQVQGLLIKNLNGGEDIQFSPEEIIDSSKSRVIPAGEYRIVPLTNHDKNSPHFSAFFVFWDTPTG